MIIRNRKINPNAKEVMLSVSFTSADVRRWLEEYANLRCRRIFDETLEEVIEDARHKRETEESMRFFFEHQPSVFRNYEAPYRQQLSAWAWAQIVSLGYLTQSATKPEEFLFTDKFLNLVK